MQLLTTDVQVLRNPRTTKRTTWAAEITKSSPTRAPPSEDGQERLCLSAERAPAEGLNFQTPFTVNCCGLVTL